MDQHFPLPASQGLRRHGVHLLTAQEAGRCGFSDSDQLAFATAQERVLVTFDTDFLALHRTGIAHSGIVWCPEQKYRIGQLIQALLLVHGILDRDSMRNHVEYL
jgi:predicted nuclease of predicted toxin-antitoxin system